MDERNEIIRTPCESRRAEGNRSPSRLMSSSQSSSSNGANSYSPTNQPRTRAVAKEKITHNIEGSGVRLNITISKKKQVDRPELLQKYDIKNYELLQGSTFSEKYMQLIPKGTPEYVDRGEKYVERITRALYHFKQCALIGPSGTGKTHIVYLVAELAGLPLWEINCGLQTSVYDLFGRYVGLGKENWIDGQIVSWCRSGGILYLDEANMMKQDVATRLNPVLDTRGHLVLTEKDNEIIPRHPAGYVIISMNPYSAEFAGTKPLNAAFRRRMSVWIDFDYLSVGQKVSPDEITLVEKRSKVPEDIATKLVRIGAELRRQYKANEIPYGPSVGDLVNWGLLIADGVAPESAAEETIIAMTSDNAEIQDNVRRVVQMIFGGLSGSSSTHVPQPTEAAFIPPEPASKVTAANSIGQSPAATMTRGTSRIVAEEATGEAVVGGGSTAGAGKTGVQDRSYIVSLLKKSNNNNNKQILDLGDDRSSASAIDEI
jgi:nitric oxide reductase NorQ protein